MRLTEETVQFLTSLQNHHAAISPDDFAEAITECEHDGLIVANGSAQYKLTEAGRSKLLNIQQRLTSVDQLKLYQEAKIAYLSQRNYDRFQKLQALGLSSGVPIKLQQRFPSYVIQCEETEIALEEEIARDIFVWKD